MKKILAVLLAMAMIFGLAACSGGSEPAAESTSVIDEIKANGKLLMNFTRRSMERIPSSVSK